MEDHIRLLEQRVQSAVDRLNGLHDERNRLREELRTLSDRLERCRQSAAAGSRVAQSWQGERARIVAEVRQALDELRGD